MNIHDLIGSIPEDSCDEALEAIESIVVYPATQSARIRAHLAAEFRLMATLKGGIVTVAALGEGCAPKSGAAAQFPSLVKAMIYEVDQAISVGRFTPQAVKPNIIFDPPPPPSHMDIPHWDGDKWVDLEW
ncbi:MAG TPA: hypothetical protein VFG73_02345 [Rhodanobacteraceae bacterium]|nr:hypothetical protein [Rhodanobacteraceae bacterium]